jgi:hypothetical protein
MTDLIETRYKSHTITHVGVIHRVNGVSKRAVSLCNEFYGESDDWVSGRGLSQDVTCGECRLIAKEKGI